MDKYTLLEKIFIYFGIFIFMTFILLPFVEMFYASLRPLDHLFRSPYQFYSDVLFLSMIGRPFFAVDFWIDF